MGNNVYPEFDPRLDGPGHPVKPSAGSSFGRVNGEKFVLGAEGMVVLTQVTPEQHLAALTGVPDAGSGDAITAAAGADGFYDAFPECQQRGVGGPSSYVPPERTVAENPPVRSPYGGGGELDIGAADGPPMA